MRNCQHIFLVCCILGFGTYLVEVVIAMNYVGIGNRILYKLKTLNLKQTDLCTKTGLSSTAISNYCTEKRIPDTDSLYKISTALNTSMEWLLTGKDTTNEEIEKDTPRANNFSQANEFSVESVIQMLQMMQALPKSQQQEILAFIDFKYNQMINKKKASVFCSQDQKNNSATA